MSGFEVQAILANDSRDSSEVIPSLRHGGAWGSRMLPLSFRAGAGKDSVPRETTKLPSGKAGNRIQDRATHCPGGSNFL